LQALLYTAGSFFSFFFLSRALLHTASMLHSFLSFLFPFFFFFLSLPASTIFFLFSFLCVRPPSSFFYLFFIFFFFFFSLLHVASAALSFFFSKHSSIFFFFSSPASSDHLCLSFISYSHPALQSHHQFPWDVQEPSNSVKQDYRNLAMSQQEV
jgi:hypothetical protein